MGEEVLYIGIDLGTFRSVMVSSDSHEEEELTVIGTPKDPIARNFLKRDVLFGEEALKNRLALNLFRPLEHGVIKDTPEDRDFIAHFITHLLVYLTQKNMIESLLLLVLLLRQVMLINSNFRCCCWYSKCCYDYFRTLRSCLCSGHD